MNQPSKPNYLGKFYGKTEAVTEILTAADHPDQLTAEGLHKLNKEVLADLLAQKLIGFERKRLKTLMAFIRIAEDDFNATIEDDRLVAEGSQPNAPAMPAPSWTERLLPEVFVNLMEGIRNARNHLRSLQPQKISKEDDAAQKKAALRLMADYHGSKINKKD